MNKAIFIDGGVGRIICSLPAVEEYVKQNKKDTVVITGWLDAYLNNKIPKRVYHINQAYLWEDVIKNVDLLHPEPYWDYDYYNQKTHLIQAFYKCLGLKVPKDIPKPKIYLQEQEIEWAKELLANYKKQKGKNKVMIFQPYGAGARAIPLNSELACSIPNNSLDIDQAKIIDESNRSLSRKTARKIEKELEKDVAVLIMSHIIPLVLGNKNPNEPPQPATMRQWIALIHEADYVVGIDSCAQHLTYAFDKLGFFIYGGTSPENLSYKEHKIFKKEGFPKEYNPIRLPANPMQAIPVYNEGAMNFTKEEEEKLITNIKTFIKN